MTEFSIKSITPGWLSHQLGIRVEGVSVVPLTDGGYLSDVFHLTLRTQAGTSSLVLKMSSANEDKRKVADQFNSYQKEADFYRLMADDVGIRVPKHRFVVPPPDFAIALEDLADLEDVSPFTGADRQQAITAMQTLARLHATPIPAKASGFEEAFLAAAASLPGMTTPLLDQSRASGVIRAYLDRLPEHLALFLEQDPVVAHMDFRLSNLRYDNDELIVFDWGEWCLAPRGMDIVSFALFSLTTSQRRALETELLSVYRAASGHDAFDSYRLGLLPAIYLPALILEQARDPALGKCFLERVLSAVDDHTDWLLTRLE